MVNTPFDDLLLQVALKVVEMEWAVEVEVTVVPVMVSCNVFTVCTTLQTHLHLGSCIAYLKSMVLLRSDWPERCLCTRVAVHTCVTMCPYLWWYFRDPFVP